MSNHFHDAFDPAHELEMLKAEKNAKLLARSEPAITIDHAEVLEDAARFSRGKRLVAAKKLLPELLAWVESQYPEYSLNQKLAVVAAIAALAQL